MVLGGVYPNDVQVQLQGSNTIAPLNASKSQTVQQSPEHTPKTSSPVLPQQVRFPPPQNLTEEHTTSARPLSTEAKFAWGVAIAGTLVLLWIFAEISSPSSPKSGNSYSSSNSTNSSSATKSASPPPRPSSSPSLSPKPAVAETIYAPTPPPPSYTPSSTFSTLSPSFGSGSSSVPPSSQSRPAVSESIPRHPPRPSFNEPILTLPRSGEVRKYLNQVGVAPLQIRSSVGDNYLVKLDDVVTGQPVLSVFVRGGQTEEIKVPLGTYMVKYASGTQWYGYTHLFGPQTEYSKADQTFTFSSNGYQYSGYTITLYKVRDGNLRTSKIQPTDF
jgi:hypothetical protein